EVVSRLQAEEKKLDDPDRTMIAWGLDPIFFDGQPLTAPDLDRVSTTRPVYINHASGHACTVNTAAIRHSGVDEATDVEGVSLDADGAPNGELHEFAAMGLVQELAKNSDLLSVDAEALEKFGQNAVNTGTTTVTDLGSRLLMSDEGVQLYRG